MIEVNLLPDVKQELVRAQRQRNMVVSGAIFVAIAAGVIVVLLALYVFGAQTLRDNLADSTISSKSNELKGKKDLGKSLTVQNQLSKISAVHAAAPIDSRVFSVLTTITPTQGENAIALTNFSIDSETKTITIEGQADRGFVALDAFKKTILATKFEYSVDGNNERKSVQLTDKISDGNRSFSQNVNGRQTLQFNISFVYPDELLDRSSISGKVIAPERSNVTDSRLDIPSSLFTVSGGNQ